MPKRKVDVRQQKEEIEGDEPSNIRPQLSKEEIKKLFDSYDAVDAAFESAKSKVDAFSQKRQAAVRDIYEQVGAGPFTRKGRKVRISKRGEVYFFRGESDADTIEID